jgi:elongation factor G
MIADRLGARPIVLQLPVGHEGDFVGVVDLVAMQALRWEGPSPTAGAIPEGMRDAANEGRQRLLETLADQDDAIMAAYIGGEAVEASEVKAAIRKTCIAGRLTPVLCGSAYRNVGVQPLLDAIVDYAPAPSDRPPVAGTNPRTGDVERRLPRPDEPFVALVSKMQTSRFGALAFIRVYAGRVAPGTSVVNAATRKVERIGRLLRMHADSHVEISEASAGDVVAVVGLKSVRAGDTLSDPARPVVLTQLSLLEEKSEQNQQGPIEGLHYKTGAGGRADLFEDVMRGGGCGGKSSLSCLSSSFWSALSSVWRLRISVRPSVVGKCTSSICTAAILSSTARDVRPGASGFSRARNVTCRQ